ncbi:tRNA1(Val) (adenine(37)-N6)-methyltransferase [Evansella cellulosilytica]|uniref:Methyltransferase small n=1 Tax=Evansella cellulosilytica (strain ATCC 21833 / DSM 2522 / FERM P-1141 / JCM 9156 / N-4) TaxID=649639 RepID=E6TRN3_EVAC2|nr:tRNA1(Val) (adenine(37)-N6)-methyltransferase [Evansella cellulosilytica]ADU28327.1 methyltransferase small [Evansella cellulosilytica DSM 2522]
MERLDYMPGKQRYIYQRKDIFSFSMDAVLLGKFAKVPKEQGKVIDLCSGNGAIPLMLSVRTEAKIDAVEIQDILCSLAERSVSYNGLEEQINVINKNILHLQDEVEWGTYDLVTCNPPYFPVIALDRINNNEKVSYARHEIACNLEDVIRISSRLVKQTGRLAMVHRPERVVEIITLMTKYQLEPKRIQYVHPKKDREANMVLIEGSRAGKPGIKTLPPFIVYGDGKEFTEEFNKYYHEK